MELHSIKEKVLPEIDEDFLSKFGMSSEQELRETVAKNLKRNIEDIEKSLAQKKNC